MGVIASTWVIERRCEVQLAFLIIPHRLALVSLHSDDFHDFNYFEL
jgi:hypothetical protein